MTIPPAGSLYGAPLDAADSEGLWAGSPMGVTPPVTPPRSPRPSFASQEPPAGGGARAPTLASALHSVDERAVEHVGEGIEQLGLHAAAARYQDAVVGVVPVWEQSLRWKNIALAVFEVRADVDKVELPLDGAGAPTTVRCNHLYEPIMVRGEWVFHQRTTAHSNDQWTRHLFSLVYGEPARTTANVEAFVHNATGAVQRIAIVRPQAASKLAQMAGAVPVSALLIFDPPEERLEQLRDTRDRLRRGEDIGYSPATEAVVGRELSSLPLRGDRSADARRVWSDVLGFFEAMSALTAELIEMHATREVQIATGRTARICELSGWQTHLCVSRNTC